MAVNPSVGTGGSDAHQTPQDAHNFPTDCSDKSTSPHPLQGPPRHPLKSPYRGGGGGGGGGVVLIYLLASLAWAGPLTPTGWFDKSPAQEARRWGANRAATGRLGSIGLQRRFVNKFRLFFPFRWARWVVGNFPYHAPFSKNRSKHQKLE